MSFAFFSSLFEGGGNDIMPSVSRGGFCRRLKRINPSLKINKGANLDLYKKVAGDNASRCLIFF